jgi:hypothetical protein
MTQKEYGDRIGISQPRVAQLIVQGMPMTSPEEADEWRRTNIRTRTKPIQTIKEPEGPYRPPESQQPSDANTATADSPEGAYERQKQIERAAYALTVRSLKNGQPDAARLVAVHAQAARNLTAAREDVLNLAERERRLVSGDWVRRIMTDHDGAVVQLLKAMPKQLSGRIAPHDPEHCEKELDRWVQEVALRTLHNTDPWK